jgi:hypothetical protein
MPKAKKGYPYVIVINVKQRRFYLTFSCLDPVETVFCGVNPLQQSGLRINSDVLTT